MLQRRVILFCVVLLGGHLSLQASEDLNSSQCTRSSTSCQAEETSSCIAVTDTDESSSQYDNVPRECNCDPDFTEYQQKGFDGTEIAKFLASYRFALRCYGEDYSLLTQHVTTLGNALMSYANSMPRCFRGWNKIVQKGFSFKINGKHFGYRGKDQQLLRAYHNYLQVAGRSNFPGYDGHMKWLIKTWEQLAENIDKYYLVEGSRYPLM